MPGPKPAVHAKWKSENCWPLKVKVPEDMGISSSVGTPSKSKSIAAPAASTRFPLKCKVPSGSPGQNSACVDRATTEIAGAAQNAFIVDRDRADQRAVDHKCA